MSETEKPSESQTWILASAIPFVAYWLAFVYQYGYNKHFGIPINFIEVDLINVLICFVTVIGYLSSLPLFSELARKLKKKIPRILYTKITRIAFALIIGAMIGFVVKTPIELFMIYFINFGVLCIIFDLIIPTFIYKGDLTYTQKLEISLADDYKRESAIDDFASNIGHDNFSLIFKLSIISIIFLFLGSFTAYIKSDFIVSENNQLLVLKKYKDNFLVVPFNDKESTYEAKFQLTEIKQFGKFHIHRVNSRLKETGGNPHNK